MLPEAAANGRATTKNAEPITVATKQPGRSMVTSAIAAAAFSSFARQRLVPAKLTRAAHKTVNNFLFHKIPFRGNTAPVRIGIQVICFFGNSIYSARVSHKSARITAMVEQFRDGKLDPHYTGFFDCFNRQLFFEAHEVLESLWLKDKHGANGDFYKGLIQLAGAFVHLQKNRLRPAAALFKLAQANLEKYPGVHEQLEVTAVLALIAGWLRSLEEKNFTINPLAAGNLPVLRLEN